MAPKTKKSLSVLIICLVFLHYNSFARFNWVEIGVNGLTCSQCCRSVEMSIRKLDFVSEIIMNLENTEGKITFKEGAVVNIEKIAQAVVDAGFAVRYLKAGFLFDNKEVNTGTCFAFESKNYQFIKTVKQNLNGETTIKFIGKNFLDKKELKNWKSEMIVVCTEPKAELLYITL